MLTVSQVDSRLLSACNCAYLIDEEGHFQPPVSPRHIGYCFYQDVGYLSVPKAFAGGLLNINAALIGETDMGIILAFRGTLPPSMNPASWLDWLQDLFCEPISVDGLPGKIHEGIYVGYDTIKAPIKFSLSYWN